MTTLVDLSSDSLTSSQVSNYYDAVLEIFMNHKFQRLQEVLNWKSLTRNAIT